MKTAQQIYDEIEYEVLNEAAITIKKEYPAGLTNTAKYVSDKVLNIINQI